MQFDKPPDSPPLQSKISDEDYLILKTRKCYQHSLYEAKSWILTAKTLFPQSFKVLLEAYIIEKKLKNTQKASQAFTALFHSFVLENDFWEELHKVVTAVLTDKPNTEQMFLKAVFNELQPQVRHDVLTLASERSTDPLEHSRILLLLLTKFPQTVPRLGVKLAETLIAAEKRSTERQIVPNIFRKILVHDLVPLLLERKDIEIPMKMWIRLLHKSIGCYINYHMMEIFEKKVSATKSNPEKDLFKSLQTVKSKQMKKYDFAWDKLFHLVKICGQRFDWELCSVFEHPWDSETVWQIITCFISSRPSVLEKYQRQLVHCLTVLFSCSLCHYYDQLQCNDEGKCSVILVEGFVSPYPSSAVTCESPKFDDAPTLTTDKGSKEVVKYFLFAVKCWEMIHSTEPLQKEFMKLKQSINLDPWLADFLFDLAMYDGKIEKYPAEFLSDTTNLKTTLRRLSYNFCLDNRKVWSDCCMDVIRLMETVTELGTPSSKLVKPGKRHLHFLPIQKLPLLQYIVKIITMVLMEFTSYPNIDRNRLNYQLLTLSQFNWPSEQQLAKNILSHIREVGFFRFNAFTSYITNVVILEEFMNMLLDEKLKITLDILPLTSSKKFEHVKEMREYLKKVIRNQVKHSDEPLHSIIINFLLQEEQYLPRWFPV